MDVLLNRSIISVNYISYIVWVNAQQQTINNHENGIHHQRK